MSFKNTYKSSVKQFLVQLAKMYDKMCAQLFSFANAQCKYQNSLSTILQNHPIKNSIDRKVRVQHQLQLFRQTLRTIQAYLQKKNVKRSDVAMKFISATQVLVNRIKTQVVFGKVEIAKIISIIQQNKEQILKVFQKPNASSQKKQTQAAKITDSYVLKFAYTETTRPTTEAMSRIQSAIQTPEHRGTFRPPTSKNIPSESQENSFLGKAKNKRHVTDTSLVTIQKMKSYGYNKTFCPTETNMSKKFNNFTLTQSQSQDSIVLENNQPKQAEFLIINQQQKQEICNNYPTNLTKYNPCRFKNSIKFQQTKQIQSSQDSQRAAQQQKKSLYYSSQNYLKSSKKIEGISLLNQKKKQKVSACIQKNNQIFEDTDQININFKQSPTNYKLRKFVTRKQISGQFRYQNLIKSQKSIPRCSTIAFNQALQKNKNEITKISKLSKIKSSLLVPDKIQSIKKITTGKFINDYHKKQFLGELGLDGQNEIKQIKDNLQGKTIKQIYGELISVRKDFIEKTDPEFRTFSIFFNQQLYLQQEENRRIQRLVKQSKNYCYLQEFQMIKHITNPQAQSNINREQAFLAGVRGHLKDCNVLGQIGPTNNQI